MASILIGGCPACFVVFDHAAAHAQTTFSIIRIADSAGPFGGFGPPAINNSGEVAFEAFLDNNSEGIFSISSGLTTVIAQSNNFERLSGVSINSSGAVAFTRTQFRLFPLPNAVFVGDGGAPTPIAEVSGEFLFFGPFTSINDSGTVAFVADLDAGGQGVFVGNGGPATKIADTSGGFNDFLEASINNAATVAFYAGLDDGGSGVFISSDGATSTIADSTGAFFGFKAFTAINDGGAVAFLAHHASLGGGIFASGGGSTALVRSEVVIPPFPLAINDTGTVAYQRFDGVVTSVFTDNDPRAVKVIAPGDALFGSTVTEVAFSRGLNDQGDIAFAYILADGIRGLAVARPIPEPTSVIHMSGACGVLVFIARHLARHGKLVGRPPTRRRYDSAL